MKHNYKLYGSVVVLGFFSSLNVALASGGASANYQIDNDTVSSVITQNSSSANYSTTQQGADSNQLTASSTATSTGGATSTSSATSSQVAAASNAQQVTSGGSGLHFILPPLIPSLPSLGVLPIISRVFPSIFGPQEATSSTTSAPEVAPTPSHALFDIRALSTRQTYITNEQPEVRILFDNFGGLPTKVDFTISVENSSGHEILRYVDSTTVETTGVYAKGLDRLPVGSYRVIVRTQYGKAVRDVFRFNFTVSTPPAGVPSVRDYANSVTPSMPWQGWAWVSVAALSLLGVIILRRRGIK